MVHWSSLNISECNDYVYMKIKHNRKACLARTLDLVHLAGYKPISKHPIGRTIVVPWQQQKVTCVNLRSFIFKRQELIACLIGGDLYCVCVVLDAVLASRSASRNRLRLREGRGLIEKQVTTLSDTTINDFKGRVNYGQTSV